MIGGVTRQGGYPGLPDRVTLLAGVKFCHVNVSRWGNPPSRGRIPDTSNSAFKFAARAASECKRALITKTRGLLTFFLFTYLATIQ